MALSGRFSLLNQLLDMCYYLLYAQENIGRSYWESGIFTGGSDT